MSVSRCDSRSARQVLNAQQGFLRRAVAVPAYTVLENPRRPDRDIASPEEHMRPYLSAFLIALGTLSSPSISAQDIRAVTEDGRKVVLSQDGRWRFDRTSLAPSAAVDSVSPYQTAVPRFSVAYDASKWVLSPKRDGDEINKRTFRHKSLPVHAVIIADEIPLATDALKNIILSNAQSAGATTTVLLDQEKQLSGKDVGFLRFAANLKGMDFVFSSHYYGDGDGNIQVMCFTAQSIFFKYEGECQQFLAGLTIK
jgi:hypothetical protein